MKSRIVVFTLTLVFLAIGLKAQNKPAEVKSYSVDQAFQEQLAKVYKAGLVMKDAFVASKPEEVKQAAANAKQTLAAVNKKLLSGEAQTVWERYLGELNEGLESIKATAQLDEQRKEFAKFSSALYKSIKAFGIGEEKAFLQYCPMALGTGAFWLSNSKEIQNPYYGDKMLRCGSVKESL